MQTFKILIKKTNTHTKHYAFLQLYLRGHGFGLASFQGQEQFPRPCVSPQVARDSHAGSKDWGVRVGRQAAEHTVVKTTEPGKLLMLGLSSSASGLVFTMTEITGTTKG